MSILKKPPFKLLSQQLEKISYLHGIKNDIQKNNEVSKLPEKTDFILSMYVVYLVAAWESYIEAMVKKGVDVLLNHGNDPGIFTYKVLLRVSAKLAESKDKREIWKIAGQGWKEQMEEHVRNEVEKFHSPRPDKIDGLFEATLGLKSVSASWIWDGEDNESVKKKLKQIIDIRGSIAHGIYPNIALSVEDNYSYMRFIYRIAGITNDVLNDYLYSKVAKQIFPKSGWEAEML